ncbi:heparan-alpha-glucosaminide N-acetyltransferase [Desulfitobacterium sp. THU1]|uniref:heparan-alpha-glucosaminide N-acetyltransferase n=1 Tax=Desulfitobacterium sp. THU1 TaxID=3138072 RepID=UPI00312037F1
MVKQLTQQRVLVIDYLRTLALVLMILYHLVYDLDQWTTLNVNVNAPFWFVVGKTAALLFIFLSGLSSGFSHRAVKNGLRILFFGMIITVVTYIIFPEQYVRFGILHFLGVMLLLYPLLRRLPNSVLIFATVLALSLGFYFSEVVVHTHLALPLGLMYPGFSSMDYYPLFPYSGATFLGILAYRYFFATSRELKGNIENPASNKEHHMSSNTYKKRAADPIFTWISRHSLAIYLIHQPVLLAIILGIGFLL